MTGGNGRTALLGKVAFSCALMAVVVLSVLACIFSLGEENGVDAQSGGGYGVAPNDLIIAEAESYLGAPYGSGPGYYTCTEFTRLVIGNATGVWMSTIPQEQMNYGWEPQKTKRGDLIFYSEDGWSITHVAIYMGDGLIIHASDYFMDVHVSYSSYMEYAYVTTRRVR